MAIQTVFVGTTPGDDTGDPARTAFIKINDNFTQAENAASRLVGTAAGNVMEVGAFGLGGISGEVTSYPVTTTQTGFSKFSETGDSELPQYGMSLVFGSRQTPNTTANGNWLGQLYSDTSGVSPTLRFRRSINGGAWGQSVGLLHTGNMQPELADGLNCPRLMRNVTGSTVNNEATTTGSGLRFCDFSTAGVLTASAMPGTGTWKNISGTALDANEYGLFVRIA